MRLSTISGFDKNAEYVAYEYFTKSFARVNIDSVLDMELDIEDMRIWSIYPIKKDEGGEYIMLGNTDKFLPIPSKYKKKTYLKDIM